MVWLLLAVAFVAALAFTLRPHLGHAGTALLVALAALIVGIAFSPERLRFSTSEIDSRNELLGALIWTGLLLSIVLIVRALVGRSWLSMWLAALGTLPFLLLSFIGGYICIVTCLLLAAAVALRHAASARGWLFCLLGGLLLWIILIPLSSGVPPLVPRALWLPLLTMALLLPLLPGNLSQLIPWRSAWRD